jgi:chemotaxis protein methyltransferase WspC
VRFSEIETLLAARLGFDVHTIGAQAVEPVLRWSMDEAGCSDPTAYARMLVPESDVWNRLVDRVVVPETWFFRDIAPFKAVASLATASTRSGSDHVLRILSCPCSSGEEPYSLVMALIEAGARPESFVVDAVDVSRRALGTAQAAVFRARSFREASVPQRDLYFERPQADGLWRLKRFVAGPVRFQQGNLIAPDFLHDQEPYDVVFCRNLLIYLHTEARLLAIAALRRLVAHDGVLVVGHAEAGFALEHGFRPVGPASAFAFSRSRSQSPPKAAAKRRNQKIAASVTPPPNFLPNLVPVEAATGAATQRELTEPSHLVMARRLGDTGHLHEALRMCTEYLQQVPDSAEGHFLFGVLQDALGRSEVAVDCFRKALYLDPLHYEALLYMALKREALGDDSGAALFRERARRAQKSE